MTARTMRIPIEDLDAMPRGCAWQGCTAHYQGDMPTGWVSLTTYWSPQPILDWKEMMRSAHVYRDAVLCPDHNRQLENLLKALR